MTYVQPLWKKPELRNNKWIVVRKTNGDVDRYNAEYVESVEYLENDGGIPD